MALAATTVWEVQTGGNDANGGGFVSDSGGTDWSQQAAAKEAQTDGACSDHVTFVFTSAAASFQTDDALGNIIQITDTGDGGHFVLGFYEIKVVTNETTVTLDRDPTDGTNDVGADYNMGGCLATPGMASSVPYVAGQHFWIKAGTYTLSNAVPSTSGGPPAFSAALGVSIQGYQTTRGDLGTAPVVDAGAQTAITIFTLGNANNNHRQAVINVKVDGQSGAGNNGFSSAACNIACLCEAVDCPGTGFSGRALDCTANACGTGFSSTAIGCEAIACTTYGFNVGTSEYAVRCLARSCAIGFYVGSNPPAGLIGCTADGSTGDGFALSGKTVRCIVGCVAVHNGGYGFNVRQWNYGVVLFDCAAWSNTSGNVSTTVACAIYLGFDDLSAEPFVDRVGADFRPNDTVGGGADLRGALRLIVSQDAFDRTQDKGAVQHTDPAGGGGLLVHPGTSGGARG